MQRSQTPVAAGPRHPAEREYRLRDARPRSRQRGRRDLIFIGRPKRKSRDATSRAACPRSLRVPYPILLYGGLCGGDCVGLAGGFQSTPQCAEFRRLSAFPVAHCAGTKAVVLSVDRVGVLVAGRYRSSAQWPPQPMVRTRRARRGWAALCSGVGDVVEAALEGAVWAVVERQRAIGDAQALPAAFDARAMVAGDQ
jgi:hypothetical protein